MLQAEKQPSNASKAANCSGSSVDFRGQMREATKSSFIRVVLYAAGLAGSADGLFGESRLLLCETPYE